MLITKNSEKPIKKQPFELVLVETQRLNAPHNVGRYPIFFLPLKAEGHVFNSSFGSCTN